ncbi:MAG: proteasome subunit alpha [Acidobacteria bacterium]|nr:proteasome subunit alpha [Acidobacteriota bacterium]
MMEFSQFVSPKELLKIKRDIVEEALARANPIVALEFKKGILLLAENPSSTLNKIAEIYDRIAFAGTGVYNDYEKLRRAGVQYADLKGFAYSRKDVKAKALASEFSTTLGEIFSSRLFPLEVEILLVELGEEDEENHIYYIPASGGLIEEKGFAVIGDIFRHPETEELKKNVIRQFLAKEFPKGKLLPFKEALRLAHRALASAPRSIPLSPNHLELAILDGTLNRERKLHRFSREEIKNLLSS